MAQWLEMLCNIHSAIYSTSRPDYALFLFGAEYLRPDLSEKVKHQFTISINSDNSFARADG